MTLNMLEKELTGTMDTCFQKRRKKKTIFPEENKITDCRFKQVINILTPLLRKGKTEKEVATLYIKQLKELQVETVQQRRTTRLKDTLNQLKPKII